MRRALAFLVMIATCAGGAEIRPLDELLAEIPSLEAGSAGIDAPQQVLAGEIARHGPAAIDPLVGMLDGADRKRSNLVGYCLLELPPEGFEPRHFQPLAKAARIHRGWLPGVIARIGSDEAVAFLASEMRREPETMAQIDHALVRLAPRSIAPLLAEFQQADESETAFHAALCRVFRICGKSVAGAVDPLLRTAIDADTPVFRRCRAVRLLGEIGPAAAGSFATLKSLAESEPEPFAEEVRNAIANSRTADAAGILLERAVAEARTKHDFNVFSSLACEVAGISPQLSHALIALLDDPDPHVRLGACRSLGFTKDPDAWPQLCRMLRDGDWRIAFSASLSLAQLRAKGALPSLERCRETHWYPRVRHAADFAIRSIQGGGETKLDMLSIARTRNEPELEDVFDAFGLTDYASLRLGDDQVAAFPFREPPFDPLYFDPGPSFSAGNPYNPDAAPPGPVPEVILENSLERTHPDLFRAIHPLAGVDWKHHSGLGAYVNGILRSGNSTLVGIDAGEWVAGLFAVDPAGNATMVFYGNIAALLVWDGRVVFLSGSYHMGRDRGALHLAEKTPDGWRVSFLHALPGCPWTGAILQDGRLFANCQGGAVAISMDGTFEFLGAGTADENR